MNKFLAIVFLSFSALAPLSEARAQAFVEVYPTFVRARVVNNSPFRVLCEGHTYGMFPNGYEAAAWFRDVILPGDWRFAFVHTNVYAPFVRGRSDIRCFPF